MSTRGDAESELRYALFPLANRRAVGDVVARVDDPYSRLPGSTRSPLPVGLFVEAEIEGVEVDGVFEIPRAALRRNDSLWVVDDSDQLHIRRIEVLRFGRNHVWIRAGLETGERVVTSSLEIVTEGMEVRTTELVGDGKAIPGAGSPSS